MPTPPEITAPGILRGTWRPKKYRLMREIRGNRMKALHYHELGFLIDNDEAEPEAEPEAWWPIVLTHCEKIHVHATARLDSFLKIEGGLGVLIGRWVHIASMCHINIGGGEVVFEEGSCAASGVKVIAGSNCLEGISCSAAAPEDQQVVKRSKVLIRKNATIFANATILPGVTIGEGAAVGAGSVIRHDVPDYEIWAGVPARKIGESKRRTDGGA